MTASAKDNLQNMLQLGSFSFEVPSIKPKKDAVKPNFRMPPYRWCFVGNRWQSDSCVAA